MKLVIFDVDGTLVDSRKVILAAQAAAFSAHGLPIPSREESLAVVGLSLPDLFRTLVGEDGPIESLAEAYKAAFFALRADPRNAEPLFPGLGELLDALARRDDALLGIATGKSRRGVAHLLERHGWESRFATIQTAHDAPSKPHPAMIEQALAAVGAEPEEAVIVGDSSFDMLMGRAAGIATIGVSWGFQPVAALRAAGASLIVDDAADLAAALDRFLAAPRMPISVP